MVDRAERIVEAVRATAVPIIRALNLDLVEVEYAGQGSRSVVRVFIDKPGGVNVDDCEQVHVSLGYALDVEDPIPHAYVLEVSSPGLDRPLRRREDYERSKGKLVNIKLRQPLDGQWRIVGRLLDVQDQGILLRRPPSTQDMLFGWEAFAEGRLEVEF